MRVEAMAEMAGDGRNQPATRKETEGSQNLVRPGERGRVRSVLPNQTCGPRGIFVISKML